MKPEQPKKLEIGDTVLVTRCPPLPALEEVDDDIETRALLQSMVGKHYVIQDFDEYGNAELHPTSEDWVWIEPEYLERVE